MTNNEAHRTLPAYLIETALPLLLPAVAFLAVLFAFVLGAAPAQACEVNGAGQVQTSTSVAYEFATDETAAGELDVEYSNNYDYEADSPYCTVKPINGYDDAMLVQCNLPQAEAERAGIV